MVEVSKAGGFGVFGAAGLKPEQLEVELAWIDQNIGRPYGVDLIVPTSFESKGQDVSSKDMVDKVPKQHRAFVRGILAEHGIDSRVLDDGPAVSGTRWGVNMRDNGAMALLDVAFDHPISRIATALGTPPGYMLERGKSAGVAVAALVGAKEHAIKQVEAGFAGLVRWQRSKPMIAAITGSALAGGSEIALACDMIVCSDETVFGLPEVKRSLVAGAGGLFRLPGGTIQHSIEDCNRWPTH